MSKDFEGLFQLLNDHHVKYVICGGYAVGFHGHPRYTKDIDVFVEVSEENAKRILDSLEAFGFSNTGLKLEDLLDDKKVIRMGEPPYQIDIITRIDGVNFEEVWINRIEAKFGDTSVSYISRELLIQNKKSSGRKQDLVDVEYLEEAGQT